MRNRLRTMMAWTSAMLSLLMFALWALNIWAYPSAEELLKEESRALAADYNSPHPGWHYPDWVHWGETGAHLCNGIFAIENDAPLPALDLLVADQVHFPRIERLERQGRLPRFKLEIRPFKFHYFIIPLWQPAAMCGVACLLLMCPDLRGLYRRRRGRCTKCNYDRHGLNPAAACPECGEKRI
jgi:hypothetical protein